MLFKREASCVIHYYRRRTGIKIAFYKQENASTMPPSSSFRTVPTPQGGAVGMSLFVSTQTFKSNGGLNKAIRSNSTSFILFKTKDLSELQQISMAFSGEIAVDRLFQLYEQATAGEHDFLFVDLHHQKGIQASGFRQCFDTYLIPYENSEKT